jgi:hypothetical protein
MLYFVALLPHEITHERFLTLIDGPLDTLSASGAAVARGLENVSPSKKSGLVIVDGGDPPVIRKNLTEMPAAEFYGIVLSLWPTEQHVGEGIRLICLSFKEKSTPKFASFYEVMTKKGFADAVNDVREIVKVSDSAACRALFFVVCMCSKSRCSSDLSPSQSQIGVTQPLAFLKKTALTRPLLVDYVYPLLESARQADRTGANIKSERVLVPFHRNAPIFKTSWDAVKKAVKPKKMSSTTGDIWTSMGEGEKLYVDSVHFPPHVGELCDVMDEFMKTYVHQGYNLGITLDEDAIQRPHMFLERLLTLAAFSEAEFENGELLTDASNTILSKGEAHVDAARAAKPSTARTGRPATFFNAKKKISKVEGAACAEPEHDVDSKLEVTKYDALVKVEEIKAPKEPDSALSSPPGVFSGPRLVHAKDPAPLSKAHITQCLCEMEAIMGRQTYGRPIKLSEIQNSPYLNRLWGQVHNGIVGVTIRYLGPDRNVKTERGDEDMQVLHLTRIKVGSLFREHYTLMVKSLIFKHKCETATEASGSSGTGGGEATGTSGTGRGGGGAGQDGSGTDRGGEGGDQGRPRGRPLWGSSFRALLPRFGKSKKPSSDDSASSTAVRRGLADMSNTNSWTSLENERPIWVPIPPPVPVNPIMQEWHTGVPPSVE